MLTAGVHLSRRFGPSAGRSTNRISGDGVLMTRSRRETDRRVDVHPKCSSMGGLSGADTTAMGWCKTDQPGFITSRRLPHSSPTRTEKRGKTGWEGLATTQDTEEFIRN